MDFFTCSLEKLEFVQLVMGMNSKKYDEYTFTSKLKVWAIWIFVSLAKTHEKKGLDCHLQIVRYENLAMKPFKVV